MKINFFNLRNKNLKVGLALGGGGARGFAHIGVIKAFEEHGIKFDYVAGTSAGAIVGAMYCKGLKSDEMIKIASQFSLKDIKTSKIPLMPNRTEALENVIADILNGATFKDLKTPFCAVAVDVKTGNEIHLTSGDVAKCVSASCAVPGFFTPVQIGNNLLFDGGLMNNIPANVPKLHGCDVVIAVDINSTRGQGTESDKYIDLILASIAIMMKSNSLGGYLNADIMIQPDMKRFKSTKIIDYQDMIEEGYKAAIYKIDEIKKLLGQKVSVSKQKKFKNKVNYKNKMMV